MLKHLTISVMAILLVLSPVAVFGQDDFVDLGITAEGIDFSDSLTSGANVRIYATVKNHGDADVMGYVTFFQGSIPIGDSQVISVRAGGVPEEAFVDFTVPNGSFNIRAEIRGTDPVDQNSSNDVAISKLFKPVSDSDIDSVPDNEDNCVEIPNSDQLDTDQDGQGNACDSDDDNDGVNDDVENEVGSDPLNPDTDNDGVSDADDAFPNDPKKTELPDTKVAGETDESEGSDESEVIDEGELERAEENRGEQEEVTEEVEVINEEANFEPSQLVSSPNSIFSYRRLGLNEFEFIALAPDAPDYRFEWDFGDGVTSNRSRINHTYTETGDFTIHFKVTDPDGLTAEDFTVVSVPFFSLKNPIIISLIAFLCLLLLILGVINLRLFIDSRKKKKVRLN